MTVVAPPERRESLRLRDRLRSRRQRRYADYDAFISYNRADVEFATRLERNLERLMKPWNRVRSMKVFRDISSLSPQPALWDSIRPALERSAWFILLASPEAAASRWVDQEVAWWLENKRADRLLIVLTAGALDWDGAAGDFARAAAVPPALRGRLAKEPGWLDARWSRGAAAEDPRHHDAAGDLVATIRELPKDEVFATDVREHRRTMLLARSAVIGLVALLLAAMAGGVVAYLQRNAARTQARLALSRQLAAVATANAPSNLQVSLVLAVESLERDDNPQTRSALMTAALASPHLVRFFALPARVTAFAGSADGRVIVAGLADGRVMRWGAPGGRPRQVAKLRGSVTQIAVDAAGDALVVTDGTILSEHSTALLVRAGREPRALPAPAGQMPSAVGISPSGRSVFVYDDAIAYGGAESIAVFDDRSGLRASIHGAPRGSAGLEFVVPSDDEVVMFDPGYGTWDRRDVSTWGSIDRGGVGFGTHQSAGDPSADGEYMTATNGLPTIPIWRMHGAPRNDRPTRVAVAPISSIGPLALSPDGGRLAVAASGTIYVARTTSPGAAAPAPIVLDGNGSIDEVRFFAGDSRLLSSSGTLLALWDLRQRDRLARLANVPIGYGCEGCSGPRPVLSPDGTRAAVIDGAGQSAAVVDLRTGSSARLPAGAYETPLWTRGGTAVFPAEAAAGGSRAAPAGGLPAGTVSWRTPEGTSQVIASAVTADGRDAVMVDDRGRVVVQGLKDGRLRFRRRTHPELELGSDSLTYAAVDPGDGTVATLLDGRISITALATGRTVLRRTVKGADRLAFGGRRLFVQLGDGTLQVRDARDLRLERTLPGDPSYVWPPVPDPSGKLVARQRQNGQIVVVDAGSGTTLAVLPAATSSVGIKTGAAFSGDGRRLITVTEPETGPALLIERDLSTPALIRSACRTAGSGLSADQWRRFVGTAAPQQPAC